MSGLSMDAACVGGAFDYAWHIPTAFADSVPRLSVRAAHGSFCPSRSAGCTALSRPAASRAQQHPAATQIHLRACSGPSATV
jgi:hypothetical protein